MRCWQLGRGATDTAKQPVAETPGVLLPASLSPPDRHRPGNRAARRDACRLRPAKPMSPPGMLPPIVATA